MDNSTSSNLVGQFSVGSEAQIRSCNTGGKNTGVFVVPAADLAARVIERLAEKRRARVGRHVIGLDTLHLFVKVPDLRVFERWVSEFERITAAKPGAVYEGVAVGDRLVMRRGLPRYRFSLWEGDVRAYVSNRLEQGIWLQIGPKFLNSHPSQAERLAGVICFLEEIGCPWEWFVPGPDGLRACGLRANRADVSTDCLGDRLADQSADRFSETWVGYATVKGVFWGADRALETINIGTRDGGICARVYDKVREAAKDGDLEFWRAVWGGWQGDVTRIEQEFHLKDGGFAVFLDFYAWKDDTLAELLNYAWVWGHQSEPVANDTNRSRWPVSAWWGSVVQAWAAFAGGACTPKRVYDRLAVKGDAYYRQAAGFLSGLAAWAGRSGASFGDAVAELEARGYGWERMMGRARERWEVLSRLRLVGGVA